MAPNQNFRSQEQLPPYPGSPTSSRRPPSYRTACQDRLAQVDSKIDRMGQTKQAQIDITYGAAIKGALDKTRLSLKSLTSALATVKQAPNESNRDHARRLKKANMTIEGYKRTVEKCQATRTRAELQDAEFQRQLGRLEGIEQEMDSLRKQRQNVLWDIRNFEWLQQTPNGRQG